MNRKWIAPDPITGRPGPTTETVIQSYSAGATLKEIELETGGNPRTIIRIIEKYKINRERLRIIREPMPEELFKELCGQEDREKRRRRAWRKGNPDGQPEPLGYHGYPDSRRFVKQFPPELCGTREQEAPWGLTRFEAGVCRKGMDLSDVDWTLLLDVTRNAKGELCDVGYYINAAVNNFYRGRGRFESCLSDDWDIPVDILGQPVTINKPTIAENYDDRTHPLFVDLNVEKPRPIVGWELFGWGRFAGDCIDRRKGNDAEPDRVSWFHVGDLDVLLASPQEAHPPGTLGGQVLDTSPRRWAWMVPAPGEPPRERGPTASGPEEWWLPSPGKGYTPPPKPERQRVYYLPQSPAPCHRWTGWVRWPIRGES